MKKKYKKYLAEQKKLSKKKNEDFHVKCKKLSEQTGNDELVITIKKRIKKFRHFFRDKRLTKWISKRKKVLSLGSRRGEEVMAFKSLGYRAIGVDLIPYGKNIVEGDFHNLPFADKSFNLIFSNSVDHAFDLQKVFDEMHRVLSKRGYCVLHLVIGDEYKDSNEMVTHIMSLNTPHAQAIVASRLKEVAKKGHVGILDFADMKQRLRTAVTQKSIATQKGT